MKANELKSMVSNNRKAIIAAAVITIALIVAVLAVSCSNASAVSSGMEPEPEAKSLKEAQSSGDESGESCGENSDVTAETATAETLDSSSDAPVIEGVDDGSSKDVAAISSGDSASSSQSTGVKTGSTSSNSSEQSKHWVEDTERVWVVDKAAWTEQIPVYGTVERSICNVCGADITGNTSAHNKAHMLAGEGSGYHSEVSTVQTGTNKVNHAEEGHWETRVSGGHWE